MDELDDITVAVAGVTYVTSDAANTSATGLTDAQTTGLISTAVDAATEGTDADGVTFTADTSIPQAGNAAGTTIAAGVIYKQINQLTVAASEGMLETTPDTNKLTAIIEDVQGKINTARVQAGSQYAALESAVNYTTDLTAQYELGYNTVNDVNFSMETAHLAKNQILQQAATAMLAQANQGQQGLLQLIS